MNLLVLVAETTEVQPMKRLLAQAGVKATILALAVNKHGKPAMKELRELKPELDHYIEAGGFDTVFACGETAARIALDTSTVNINKMRGRDFSYEFGVRKATKKDQAADRQAV